MDVSIDPLEAYRLKTARIGLVLTTFALVSLAIVGVVADPDHHSLAFDILVVFGAVGTVALARLPWQLLNRSRAGLRWLYIWSVGVVLLIAVAVGLTEGGQSPLFLLFAVTTAVFATYSLRARIGLFLLTVASYGAVVAWTGGGVSALTMGIRLTSLAILAYIGSVEAGHLMREIRGHQQAALESDHRAELLATVAAAGRSMNDLDPDRVLDEVVRSCVRLGFEKVAVGLYEADGAFRIVRGHGIVEVGPDEMIPPGRGVVGLVWKLQRTVTTDDYAAEPWALPEFVAAGVRVAVCTPIWSTGSMVAAMVAASGARLSLAPHDIEAFELLAADGGAALAAARRFEEERRSVERLAELDRLKGDFLSNVSHELRTPLTVILGNGRTLAERWDELSEDLKLELLDRLNANAASLGRVITTLLDFSRLESGHVTLRAVAMDLGALVGDSLSRLSSLLVDHQVEADIRRGLIVSADAALLDRVVENLVANAARHTPPGTRVVISAKRIGEEAVVSVADDGPGISPTDLEHLGERFYRGGDPNTRQSRGTGLGLALAREILEQHGSHLEIESQPGRGSRFSFRLPAAKMVVPPGVPDVGIADAS